MKTKTVKLNETELQFMEELQELLNKHNARISTTSRGCGEYETRGLSFVLYENAPIDDVNNTVLHRIELAGVISCSDNVITSKLK